MRSLNHPDEHKVPFRDIPLDGGYAHLLIEYDRESVSLPTLQETIELAGVRVIETQDFSGGREKGRLVLFTINVEDVREVILSLSKYPLINVTGYNSKK
jgi:hypothetical protein